MRHIAQTPGFPVRARFLILRAPEVAEHVAGSITSKGGTEDAAEGGGGGTRDKKVLPFNASAFDDAHRVCAILATLGELIGLAAPDDTWRRADDRKIIGYRGQVEAEGIYWYAQNATKRLIANFDGFAELDEQQHAEAVRLIDRLGQIDGRWPRSDTGMWLPHPCLCGERIVIQAPVWDGAEQMIVCTGCGALYDEAGAARIRAAAHAVVAHEQKRRKARPKGLKGD